MILSQLGSAGDAQLKHILREDEFSNKNNPLAGFGFRKKYTKSFEVWKGMVSPDNPECSYQINLTRDK